MEYILAMDQGTTSSKACLFDKKGVLQGSMQKKIPTIFPKSGWVEQDPEEIWSTQKQAALSLLSDYKISSSDILAIGITNQRETTIIWDRKTGIPLVNAIVWQDRRTFELCQKLQEEGLEPLFHKKTGLILDPYFSGTKIQWILQHIPNALEKAEKGELAFGTVDSWIVWKLTNGKLHITDHTNASRTLLYNITTNTWDEELLEILHIPKSLMPHIVSCSAIHGESSADGFPLHIPITGIIGDQQAALLGQGCVRQGMMKVTYGTGCFLLMNTGKQPVFSEKKLLTTIAYSIGKEIDYALEGSVFIAGSVIEWIKDQLHLIEKAEEIDGLVSSVEDTQGLYFVPAFTGLGSPYWNPKARGTMFGITRATSKAHIARASIEAIAYQVADVIKAMEFDAHEPLQELRVDGGVSHNHFLLQFQADLLGTSVICPAMKELTSLGAAFVAAKTLNLWNEPPLQEKEQTFFPSPEKEKMHKRYMKWQKAVELTRLWEEQGI